MLNQMVVNVISLPGVMSPQMVEEFKLAVEQATGQKLSQQVQAREALQQKLQQGLQRSSRKQSKDQPQKKKINDSEQKTSGGTEQQEVTGYKMERKDKQDKSSQLASSGVQWFASVMILLIIGLFGLGMRKERYNLLGRRYEGH
jgi:cobaltochelatase CobN